MEPTPTPPAFTPVTPSAWADVMTAFTGQISVEQIVLVLATSAAACIGLVFLWWGVRKAAGALMAAFRKGRMSI